MRFQLIGFHAGKLTKVEPFAIKLGQKQTLPAAKLRVMVTGPNKLLEQFDPALRAYLYEKAKADAVTQKTLDGIEVVSDLPTLREPGAKLGALKWDDEQTGCTFTIDHGIGGESNIVLRDCKASNWKIVPLDGGSVQVFFSLHTGELGRDTLGDLDVLHQQDVRFELQAPEPAPAGDLIQDDEGTPAPGEEYTPEKALADSVAEKGTAAEGRAAKRLAQQKKAAKKTPLAKKVARGSRAAKKAKAH